MLPERVLCFMTGIEMLTTENAERWRAVLPASESVFGSVEYARIYEEHSGYPARLAVCPDVGIAYPCFLRPIGSLPFAQGDAQAGYDLVTPEYTGPLCSLSPGGNVRTGFAEAFTALCRGEGIVTEFAHLHPWRAHTDLLDPDGVAFNREIVYVDLTPTEEEIWAHSTTHDCRWAIGRAQRHGVSVFEASEPEHIREFHRIYVGTMDRRRALQRYYFPVAFFESIFTQMRDSARFLLAEHEGRIVAAGLFLHDETNAYYHLSGSDHAFRQLYAGNVLLWEAIRWARAGGRQRFILGGSYQQGDGIFRFKASFSPLRARFHTFRKVHLPDSYDALCRQWSAHYGSEESSATYFPAYRWEPEESQR